MRSAIFIQICLPKIDYMNPVIKYFDAEKTWCIGGFVVGIVTIGLAAYWLIKLKQPFYNGMSWPLLFFGLFISSICIGIIIRTPKDVQRVTSMIETRGPQIQTEELPRMEVVMRNFKVIIVVEIVFILISAAFLFMNIASVWKGVAAGILCYAVFLLMFDVMAQSRGAIYLQFLQSIKS
jgi:hypothetical protein